MQTPKLFDTVIIAGRSFQLYDIEDREHEGANDVPKTWWVYYNTGLPEGVIPPADSEFFIPYHVSIKRRCWQFTFTQYNTTKIKWDERRFSNHTGCAMLCNGKAVYGFMCGGDINFAMAKAQYLMVILSEHSYNFFDPEKERGRKIYYHGLPATVTPSLTVGEIAIIPDYTAGLDKAAWWDMYRQRIKKMGGVSDEFDEIDEDDTKEHEDQDYINWGDALSDANIDWFRKTE